MSKNKSVTNSLAEGNKNSRETFCCQALLENILLTNRATKRTRPKASFQESNETLEGLLTTNILVIINDYVKLRNEAGKNNAEKLMQ